MSTNPVLPVEPQSVEAAQKIIADIRFGQGQLDENDFHQLEKTSLEFQEKTKYHAEQSRRTLAKFTKTIASQLYSSKFRFIYELIQNADDSKYNRTEESPYLRFLIRREELVVETNEDGFDVSNVHAICSTGYSSKTSSTETTGEKGLGFKSVFGIANDVHVLSGLWSFRFQHSKNGDGLGMVSPLWKDHPRVTEVGTRITLKYIARDENSLKILVTKFDEIPETMIMFLRQIRKLIIDYEDVGHKVHRRVLTKHGEFRDGNVSIIEDIDGRKTVHQYRVATKMITDLPDDENRTRDDQSEVVLVFPIETSSQEPKISVRGQHAFAFLPVQRLPQIPFLIQADFVVAANREAIPDTPRNMALRSWVVAVFAQAIIQFCQERGPLLYRWMMYLPVSQIEDFWQPLYTDILASLGSCRILESFEGCILKRPADLRILPPEFLDDEEPLFGDLNDDVYLSQGYSEDAIQRMRHLDLRPLSLLEMLDRVESDLQQKTISRIKTKDLEEGWHTSFADFMLYALQDKFSITRLKNLTIIPLSSGQWVAPSSMTANSGIYYPYFEEGDMELLIAENLGLRLLHPKACVVAERRSLYNSLGIQYVDPKDMVNLVVKANSGGTVSSFENYRRHLEMLFWFGQDISYFQRRSLRAVTQNWKLEQAWKLYFLSDKQYHSDRLLRFTDLASSGLREGPLHEYYMISKVAGHVQNKMTWKEWLEVVAGVRYYPDLLGFMNNSSLSPVMEAVIKDNPTEFVGTLHAHWASYKGLMTQVIRQKISEVEVPCLNGGKHQLKETFLPTNDAKAKSNALGIESHMRLIDLGDDEEVADVSDWLFLEQFGVCCGINLSFFLEALAALREVDVQRNKTSIPPLDLYRSIASIAQFQDRSRLLTFFRARSLIYIPNKAVWTANCQCVWDGPDFLRKKENLQNHYGKWPELRTLFVEFLFIGDATWDDVLQEIVAFREQALSANTAVQDSRIDVGTMATIYAKLSEMAQTEEVWKQIRDMFEKKNLIFASGTWEKPSRCIWNSSIALRGRTTIGNTYPTLQSFFVSKLKVRTMSTSMLLQELVAAARDPQANDIMDIMRGVGSMLSSETDLDKFEASLQALKKSPNGRFFIADHERYELAFRGKIRLLDFSHDEITTLHPLFKALKLERRYLSENVDTETTVGVSRKGEDLTNDFRLRSFAISCCAIVHKSRYYLNRSDQFHKMLMECDVLTSNELWTKLIVRNGMNEVEVQSDRALIKVEHVDSKMKIYVPADDERLQSCYRAEMPARLVEMLGIGLAIAEKQIYRLLAEPLTQLDRVMSDEDITPVSWLEKLPIPQDLEIEAPVVEANPAEPLLVANVHRSTLHAEQTLTYERVQIQTGGAGTFQQAVRNDQYRRVLEHVVRQAARTEMGNTFSLATLQVALNEISRSDFYHAIGMVPGQSLSFEANAKIGAAGELYVYEKLRNARMPSFDLNNWQSGIRHLVRLLPQYRNLEQWRFPEIADIMYEDHGADMERYLRAHAFDNFPVWRDAATPISYHIEVKTTVGACDTPFFMSKYQEERVRYQALTSGQRPRTVYVIVRVFDLLSDNIGMKIFVDPERLRGSVLEFIAGQWTVTPYTAGR